MDRSEKLWINLMNKVASVTHKNHSETVEADDDAADAQLNERCQCEDLLQFFNVSSRRIRRFMRIIWKILNTQYEIYGYQKVGLRVFTVSI